MELTLDISQVVLTLAVLVVSLLRFGPAKRSRRRVELAAMASSYAEQMGGTGAEKLAHAISAFQRLDLADNGKRDYSDAEVRIAIEACLRGV